MNSHTTTFVVEGLCCSAEETTIRKTLGSVHGVEIRGINIIEKTINLQHTCSSDIIIQSLNSIGMNAKPLNELTIEPPFLQRHKSIILLFSSAVFLLCGILMLLFTDSEIASIFLFTSSIALSGWNIIMKGLKAIRRLTLEMNFLMTMATFGAMAIGKWEEAAVVMFLFSLADLLERFSLKRSRNAIRALMTLTPTTARVRRDSQLLNIHINAVTVGDHVVIHPGERIPLDGTIISGTSLVNQAPITGESTLVEKTTGEEVFAGSYNERGALEINVTKPPNDTILARIIRLVEEAQSSRSPINALIDRFARTYTPTIFALACLVAIIPPVVVGADFSTWFYRALVLLVIACPCALAISTPVTIMSGLANAARHGVLIKGGKFLEILGNIKAIAFDKTGTLTAGKPHVTDIISLNSLSKEEILRTASLVERHSEHHFANAVKQKASENDLLSPDAAIHHFESLTGKGVRATINNTMYIVGSHQLIEEMNICNRDVEQLLERLENEGKSAIILATENEPVGIIAIADAIRPGAKRSIQHLHSVGIERTILLTGDNAATARSIAQQAGIDDVQFQILPDAKVNHVSDLKKTYGTVAMVGDGINDAPALATASVGIAMGKTGSDISLETADVILMSDELEKLPFVIALSKKTVQIIKQNIMIALGTKFIFLGLSVFGVATLWMAIIADDGATLLVILNGLRALRFRSK